MGGMKEGRILVLTGAGKGKSSSAFGMAFRMAGWGRRVCIIQFIKSPDWPTGEQQAASQHPGMEWHVLGQGFTWNSADLQQDRQLCRHAWNFSQERIASGDYDLVVLDEINIVMGLGWLDGAEVAAFLGSMRPRGVHVVLTGRDAPAEVMAVADTVTQMVCLRHAFHQGIPAMKGIEF
ncbi:MAG: cob(I)yrinic acid a,c-diamide adenosyltransferase [Magnetococcus sp. WYHC-3]